jgi:protein CpxP
MKTMITTLVMAMIAIAVFAQQGPPRNMPSAEERAKENTARLKKELVLTADQEKKIQEINLASAKKMDEIMKSSQGDREAARTKMTAQRTEQDKLIKAQLTAEQSKKYDELKAKMEAEWKARRQGGGQGGNPPSGQKPPTE